eukprot:4070344-Prymnesium_polylepis.1
MLITDPLTDSLPMRTALPFIMPNAAVFGSRESGEKPSAPRYQLRPTATPRRGRAEGRGLHTVGRPSVCGGCGHEAHCLLSLLRCATIAASQAE